MLDQPLQAALGCADIGDVVRDADGPQRLVARRAQRVGGDLILPPLIFDVAEGIVALAHDLAAQGALKRQLVDCGGPMIQGVDRGQASQLLKAQAHLRRDADLVGSAIGVNKRATLVDGVDGVLQLVEHGIEQGVLALHALLALQLLGHVDGIADDGRDPAVFILHRGDMPLQHAVLAVVVAVSAVGAVGPDLVIGHTAELPCHRATIIGMEVIGDVGQAAQRGVLIAQHLAEGGIEIENLALSVHQQDADAGIVERGLHLRIGQVKMAYQRAKLPTQHQQPEQHQTGHEQQAGFQRVRYRGEQFGRGYFEGERQTGLAQRTGADQPGRAVALLKGRACALLHPAHRHGQGFAIHKGGLLRLTDTAGQAGQQGMIGAADGDDGLFAAARELMRNAAGRGQRQRGAEMADGLRAVADRKLHLEVKIQSFRIAQQNSLARER